MNFTGVDATASAFAAVLAALVATAALYLQWRSTKLTVPAAAQEVAVNPGGTEGLESSPATERDTKIATNAALGAAGGNIRLKPHAERWLTPKRIAFPLLSGIAAGLIVLLVGAWLTGNKYPSVHISSPRYGTAVSQEIGFQASGTSSDLGNDTIWLADYDGSGYYIDSEATTKVGGSWTAPDSQLGNLNQTLPFPLAVRVIIAEPQCADTLQAVMHSDHDYLTSLPGECNIAGAITVEVTSRPSVHISSPRYGTAVSQQVGFQASGTSSDLGNDTIWLADYDGSGYYIDSEATTKVGGSWTAPDSQLGNLNQTLPFPLAVRVIIAEPQCADTLQAVMHSDHDYLTSLPGECVIAGTITVEVRRR